MISERKIGLRKRLQLEVFRQMRNINKKQHPIKQVFWECTLRCNLQCRHCGSDCKTATALHEDMPAEDFLKALDTITPNVNTSEVLIVITGGEPLVRKDIEDVGREVVKRGYNWGLVTNGWLLDEARLRSLLAAGMRSLTISLDGLEDDHDWMRGRKGSFARTWNAIRLLCHTTGLTWDVDTCVNRRNIKSLDKMFAALEAEGVPRWRLLSIFPMGRAAKDPDMIITDEEFEQLMEFIKQKRLDKIADKTSMLCYFGCEGFLGAYENESRGHFFNCIAGINVVSVLIDGSISACSSIRSDYHQGNIYHDNLWEVWNTKFQVYRDHSWMAKKEPCSDCSFFRYCEGGGMHQRGDNDELIMCRMKRWQR
ncbi:MAG: TIGR04133 family radical SAM/SPASM protein [Bacteroidaceae bacterium]|nr:TIGR04133 family radical SAM/SPASM protein [Bacteroidaceae bacterium]